MNVIIKLKQTLKHIVINGMEYKVLGKDTPSLKQTFNISALYIYIYTHTHTPCTVQYEKAGKPLQEKIAPV